MMPGFTIFYIISAALCSLAIVGLSGYAISHGGEKLLWLAPLFLSLFLIPLWLNYRFRTRFPAIKLILLLPILLIGGPLVYIVLINPVIERIVVTRQLSRISVTDVTEKVLLSTNKVPLVLELSYTVTIPQNMKGFVEGGSGSLFPQPNVIAVNNSSIYYSMDSEKIFKNGEIFDNLNWYRTGLTKGSYRISAIFYTYPITMRQERLCRTIDDAVNHITSSQKESPLELTLSSRADLSWRMGTLTYHHPALPLKTKLPSDQLEQTIKALPLCRNL